MTSSRREQRSTRERSPRAHRPTPARRAPPTRSPWSRRAESPARHRSTAARPPRAMSRRRRRRRRPWREREATSTMTWGPAPSVASVARRRGLGWREARPAGVPRARASLPWARTSEGRVRRRRDGELAVPRVCREPTRGKKRLERRESGEHCEPRAARAFRIRARCPKVASAARRFYSGRLFRGCHHKLFAHTSTGTHTDVFNIEV